MRKNNFLCLLLILLLSGCVVSKKEDTKYSIPYLNKNTVHLFNEGSEKVQRFKGKKQTWITFDMSESEVVSVDNEGIMTYSSNGIQEFIQVSNRTMGVLVRDQIIYCINQQDNYYEIIAYDMKSGFFEKLHSIVRPGQFLNWNYTTNIFLITEFQNQTNSTRVLEIDSNLDTHLIHEINEPVDMYPMYKNGSIFIYSIHQYDENQLVIQDGTKEIKKENLSFLSCKSVEANDSLYIITSNNQSNLYRLNLTTYELSIVNESDNEFLGLYHIGDNIILISDENITINGDRRVNIKNKGIYIKYN